MLVPDPCPSRGRLPRVPSLTVSREINPASRDNEKEVEKVGEERGQEAYSVRLTPAFSSPSIT